MLQPAALVLSLAAVQVAAAQCPGEWIAGPARAGVNGEINAIRVWDPDGAGARSPVLVVGGSFSIAGDTLVRNIALLDLSTKRWSALGSGLGEDPAWQYAFVYDTATLPNGDLVAAGTFSTAGGATVNGIARWNGSSWLPLGSGFGGTAFPEVYQLATMSNGDLIAAGRFESAGSVPAHKIARWDGAQWFAVDLHQYAASVTCLMPTPDNRLYIGVTYGSGAGGELVTWDGQSATSIGHTWSDSPYDTGFARTMLLAPNGDLIAGGGFTSIGPTPALRIARWNGTEWSQIGDGFAGTNIQGDPIVIALALRPNGILIATGNFTHSGATTTNTRAQWDGSAWTELPANTNWITPLASLPDGHVVACTNDLNGLASWDGSTWSPLTPDFAASITQLQLQPDDTVLASGTFLTPPLTQIQHLAQWDGSTWTGVAEPTNAPIKCFTRLSNQDLIVGGSFTAAGEAITRSIARWNGSEWSALGDGFDGPVQALLVMPNGDIIAGGDFRNSGSTPIRGVARWDGTRWSAIGAADSLGDYPNVESLAILPNGDLVAAGYLSAFSGVARWNGTQWTALGTRTNNHINALLAMSSGDLIVGGDSGELSRWDGTTWSAVAPSLGGTTHSTPSVRCLSAFANSELLVGGTFVSAGGVPARDLARWDGQAWHALDNPNAGPDRSPGAVATMLPLPDGSLVVGGEFDAMGGSLSSGFAHYFFGDAPPSITSQPVSLVACNDGNVAFSVTAQGAAPLIYQWRKNNTLIHASLNASAATPTLRLGHLRVTDAGSYTCTIYNHCGSVVSTVATLSICAADFNCDQTLDLFDYLDFTNALAAQSAAADFNDDGSIDFFDYLDFLQSFSAGC